MREVTSYLAPFLRSSLSFSPIPDQRLTSPKVQQPSCICSLHMREVRIPPLSPQSKSQRPRYMASQRSSEDHCALLLQCLSHYSDLVRPASSSSQVDDVLDPNLSWPHFRKTNPMCLRYPWYSSVRLLNRNQHRGKAQEHRLVSIQSCPLTPVHSTDNQ